MPTLSGEEKWDHSVENGLRKSSIGFAAGLLPSLLFARSSLSRAGILFLTTGIGAGIAYGEARYLFDHDVVFDRRHFVSVQIFPPKQEGSNSTL